MADRLMTSMAADEVLSVLRLETKLDKAVLARLACCLSRALDGQEVPPSAHFSGGEIRRSSFMGSDDAVIRALIAHVYERPDIPDEEFFSNRSIIKNHVDRGCAHLEQWFNECGRDAGVLLQRLLETVEFEGRPARTHGPGAGFADRPHGAGKPEPDRRTQSHRPPRQFSSGDHGQAWRR